MNLEFQTGTTLDPAHSTGTVGLNVRFVSSMGFSTIRRASSSGKCDGSALLQRMPRIHPIPGSAYPTPAERPAFSVLDKNSTWQALDVEGLHWRAQLRSMLQELKEL